VLQLKQRKNVPVVTAMGGVAASGGYYVACATDEIFAQPTTITGSIGVIYPRFDLSGTLEKWGAKETTITSEGSDFKNAGSMFSPDTPETVEYLRGILNDTYGRFKMIVSTARKGKLTQPIERVANGKIFTATDAEKLGLVDGLKYPNEVYAHVATAASLSNPHVVRYEHQPSIMDILGASSGIGGAGDSKVNVTIDKNLLRELTTPRVMYLWRGE
jgi:protease-4